MPRLFIWTFRGSLTLVIRASYAVDQSTVYLLPLTLVIRASYAVDQSTVKQFHDQFYDFHV